MHNDQIYPLRPLGPSTFDAQPHINSASAMRLLMIAAGFIACLVSDAAATALTYKLSANEKACFYADTKTENQKIAFYFAVRTARPRELSCFGKPY